jgi:hypothetical protein
MSRASAGLPSKVRTASGTSDVTPASDPESKLHASCEQLPLLHFGVPQLLLSEPESAGPPDEPPLPDRPAEPEVPPRPAAMPEPPLSS